MLFDHVPNLNFLSLTPIKNIEGKQLQDRFNENSVDSIGINPFSYLDTRQQSRIDKKIRSQSKETFMPNFLSSKDILMDSDTINTVDKVLDEIETESDTMLSSFNTDRATSEITKASLVLQFENKQGGFNVNSNSQDSVKKSKNLNDTMSWAFDHLNDKSQAIFFQKQTKTRMSRFIDSTIYDHEAIPQHDTRHLPTPPAKLTKTRDTKIGKSIKCAGENESKEKIFNDKKDTNMQLSPAVSTPKQSCNNLCEQNGSETVQNKENTELSNEYSKLKELDPWEEDQIQEDNWKLLRYKLRKGI